MPKPTCTVDGCTKEARSYSADWCKMHYHRWYRHGSTERVATASQATASHGRRYRTVYTPGHPLAGKRGMAYEHRVALHDKIGPGIHDCHWCGTQVRWEANRTAHDALQVDHLNGIGDDNRHPNLVPACRRCNTLRAAQARHEALVAAGFWSSHDTVRRTTRGRTPLLDA
ncbi:hypothetical protein [Prescottella equi]|uniref:hypothetical protein n=1 Tax=Rhodococcus hoagii TaxID=43767 RepID=UPI00131CF86B|nr:hypothetical protein [Prescottella equi]NKT24515.1 hypothetical protein [Prescottella equi]NKU71516.1 hypothetical protein [Prescottella equi]